MIYDRLKGVESMSSTLLVFKKKTQYIYKKCVAINQRTSFRNGQTCKFFLSSSSLMDFLSSEGWGALKVPSMFISALLSPRCSFVRFIPSFIIHGGKTFVGVFTFTDLTFSPFSSIPVKATSTYQFQQPAQIGKIKITCQPSMHIICLVILINKAQRRCT